MKNFLIFILFMIFLLGFAYFLVGPSLLDAFFQKTLPGKFIREKTQLGCTSNPNPVFTSDITDLDKISMIVPPGSMVESNGKDLLKTHAFLVAEEEVPIYAPVDSKLKKGSFYIEEGMTQYLLFFEASCEVTYKLDHVQEPVDKVKTLFAGVPTDNSRTKGFNKDIEFKAGELIGYTKGTLRADTWDFGVYNNTVDNNLETAESVDIQEEHLTAVCPFDYFSPQKQLLYRELFGNNKSGEPVPRIFCN